MITDNIVELKNEKNALDLMRKSMYFTVSGALRVGAKLKIADFLKKGPKTVYQLAEETNSVPAVLNRILRMLASENILHEEDNLTYSLTPTGEFLLTDHEYSLRDAVLMLTDETLWRPVGNVTEAVQGNPIFEALYGTSFYDYWKDNVKEDHDFQAGMSSLSKIENYYFIKSYNFPKNKTVTDIAGGLGGLLLEVLRVNPTLKGQLFDREHVLSRNKLTQLGDDSRWKLIPGDLFGSFPKSDIYLIKYIMHDWDDKHVLKILKNFRQVMEPDSKVLIIEPVIMVKNKEDMAKYIDLLCVGAFPESGERTEEEFKVLLDKADLKINRIIKSDSYNTILEVVIK